MLKLDSNQWNLVYNVFSFGLVSMLACTIYTLVSQQRVLAKYLGPPVNPPFTRLGLL